MATVLPVSRLCAAKPIRTGIALKLRTYTTHTVAGLIEVADETVAEIDDPRVDGIVRDLGRRPGSTTNATQRRIPITPEGSGTLLRAAGAWIALGTVIAIRCQAIAFPYLTVTARDGRPAHIPFDRLAIHICSATE